jgi:hypothetical protein
VIIAERAVERAKKLALVQAHGLRDALLVGMTRALANMGGSLYDAKGWLVRFGREEDADSLLISYDVAQSLDPNVVQQVINDLLPRLDYLEQTIEEGKAEGAAEYSYADSERTGDYANELRNLLVKVAAHPAGQNAIDRALKVVLVNPYPRYRDILLIALGMACVSVPNLRWVRERLQRILATGLDREGITFTFDLPSILLAESERRNLRAQELSEYLDRALSTSDRWGTAARARSAHAAVLFSQGQEEDALQEVVAADQLNIGMAGYSTLTLLSFADRCYEFGHRERISAPMWGLNKDITLIEGAMGVAQRVRDPKFREDRISLVKAYRDCSSALDSRNGEKLMRRLLEVLFSFVWLGNQDSLTFIQWLPFLLPMVLDNDMRMAFLTHISARCSWRRDKPHWNILKRLVPMALLDATTLDAILGRIFRLRMGQLSDQEVAEAIRICTEGLTTGRPWEFGQWH